MGKKLIVILHLIGYEQSRNIHIIFYICVCVYTTIVLQEFQIIFFGSCKILGTLIKFFFFQKQTTNKIIKLNSLQINSLCFTFFYYLLKVFSKDKIIKYATKINFIIQ